MVAGGCLLLGMYAGRLAVIHYKMRALFPIRCVSFLAAVAANILAASHCYHDFLDSGLADPFTGGLLVFIGLLLMPIVQMEMTALRAQYLYSEKTGQWLRYYTSKQRLVVDPEKPLPETLEDVLALGAVRKRWRAVFEFGLFLDTVPDGEHYFYALFPSKHGFFSFKFSSQTRANLVIFPIDWQQTGQLRARFGEFKKTRSIPIFSARAGNEIRNRRKRDGK